MLLSNLTIRRKFTLLLAFQAIFLMLVAFLGWRSIGMNQSGLQQAGLDLSKSQAISRILNDMNVMRTVHVSILAAAKNEAYVAKRWERLTTYEARAKEAITHIRALAWSPEEKPFVETGLRATEGYIEGFQALLQQAKARKEEAASGELMEGNVQLARESRVTFEKLEAEVQKRAMDTTNGLLRTSDRSKTFILVASLLALAVGIAITRAVALQVARAADEVANAMTAMSGGDLTTRCAVASRDELGSIAGHLNQTIQALSRDIQAIALIAERAASGATELAATTDQLSGATSEISDGAEQQRLAMAQSSASLGEMGSSIQEVREATHQAGRLSDASLSASASGAQSVQEAIQAMGAIRESSDRVSRITGVISDIARQTNLLSLNAAIEAAKAGEAGAGFAVVAEEIRKLAERSGSAAKEITELIQESSDRVRFGVGSVEAVKATLSTLERNVQDFTTTMKGIARAMEEQGQASEAVSVAMGTTMSLTERNASATTELASSLTETARTVEELASLSQQLRQLTTRFRLS